MCLYGTVEAQINNSPYHFTEIFRIGDESRGDSIFFRDHEDAQLAVNSSNDLFVGGWDETPVWSFSDEGKLIGFVGAEGEGPGEFKSSSSVVVGPGDSIYVFDPRLNRLSVFAPQTLRYSHSVHTVDASASISTPRKLLGVVKGGYLFQYRAPFRPPTSDFGGYDPDEPRVDFVDLIDRHGRMTGMTIAKLPSGERLVKTSQSGGGSSIAVMPRPFGRDPFFVLKNSNVYAGWNDAIDIAVISEKGEPVRKIRFAHEASPVTRREIEGIVKDASQRVRRWVLESESIPETKPAYDAMVVDDQGHIWIREYPNTDAEFAKWLIINSESNLVGEMELPANLLLKTIKAGRAYASINSEDYGPYVVVYLITE